MSASRPNQNKNGQAKQPSANPDGKARPGAGATVPAINPMSHPNHPLMQSPPAAPDAGTGPMGAKLTGAVPEVGANPSGNPLGNITPEPTQDVRQMRTNINFKDLQPIEQGQVAQQQGLDPYMPLQMLQQQATGAATQGPSSGPVPNTLSGPFTPPGVENFPDDMAHLTTLMQMGMGPGAAPHERAMAENAGALARAKLAAGAAQNDQSGPIAHPGAPIEPPSPSLPPAGPPPGSAAMPPQSSGYGAPQPAPGASPMPGSMPMPQEQPPIPTPQGPAGQNQPNGGAGPGAPVQPPAGGAAPTGNADAAGAPSPGPSPTPEGQVSSDGFGIHPALIAQLLAKHLKKVGK